MMKRTLRNFAILFTFASMSALARAADKSPKHGYLTDSDNDVVKSGFGLCWHTGFWTPADAIEGCDGMLQKAAPAAAAPAIVTPLPAAAPSPAPAETPVVTAPAAPAAASAAPSAEKVTFEADAFFDFDKSVLKPEGKARLADLVSKLQGTDIEVVVATGHTDSIGTDAYNMKLSLRRANAVKAFLVSKGIPADRVFTEGKGESQPVTKGCNQKSRKALIDCLQPDRRVEIEVIGSK